MSLSLDKTSDYIRARSLRATQPTAGALLADRGHDAEWFRNTLIPRYIKPGIRSGKDRKVVLWHNAALYRMRRKIEKMFARLQDRRKIA